MRANESPFKHIDWLPTGFSALDKILGGGVPSRKITEISGKFSVGKSTLALHIIAQAQKAGKDCLWADTEFSYTEEYSESLGVDSSKLDLIQARYAEETLDQVEEWLNDHTEGVVVLDSVGGLLPRQEAEKSADGKSIASQAKLIATFCRKVVPILAINNNTLVILNHNFTDIMTGAIKTSGGAKLEYAKSIWLMLSSAGKRIMQGEDQVGMVIKAEIRKNKLAPTFKKTCDLEMIFGTGFNAQADLLQEALDKQVITKKGNSYYLGTDKIAVGMAKLRDAMQDPNFAEKVTQALQ